MQKEKLDKILKDQFNITNYCIYDSVFKDVYNLSFEDVVIIIRNLISTKGENVILPSWAYESVTFQNLIKYIEQIEQNN